MSLALAAPENQQLFHRLRKGSMFPQVLLSTESSAGLWSGWARCCGFNLAQERLFCLPLHSGFSLHEQPQAATLVMACSEEGLSLHFWGRLSTLRDPALVEHYWQRLQPIVSRLSLQREQLVEFSIEETRADRFCSGTEA